MFWPWRMARRVALVLIGAVVMYLGVTFGQVVMASRRNDKVAVDAIVVLGAAQYDGRPSPVLKARLDHARELFDAGRAPLVIVTGGRRSGDRFTEADAGSTYLKAQGVPPSAIVKAAVGANSWESLSAAADALKAGSGGTKVLLVSDPFHDARIAAMARDLGLEAHLSPTHSSPIKGWSQVPYLGKETVAVAVGRIVGFDH